VTDGVLRVLGRGAFGGLMLRGGGRYEGDYLNGNMHGKGICTYANGDR
jgi:hypothetical protein